MGNASAPPADAPAPATAAERASIDLRRLDGIRQLSRVFGLALGLDRLLPRLLEVITQLLDAERGTIFLTTGDGFLESHIAEGGSIGTIRLAMGQGIAGWVAQTGETLNLPDAYADPRFNQAFDLRSGFRTRSILCVPMHDHVGAILGVIQLLNRRGQPFDSDDESLLHTVAAHAAVHIENERLIQSLLKEKNELTATQAELEERVRELDLLVEVEQEASRSLDLDELLDRLLQRAMDLTHAEAGALLLREENNEDDLYFRVARGERSESLQHTTIPIGRGIVGWVAMHREPVMTETPSLDPRHDPTFGARIGVPPRNMLAVPLIHASKDRDECLGALEVLNRRGETKFDDADRQILTLIAGQASKAIVIARARLEREQSGRLASVGQMMSGVMHDLKTPMTIVSGYAQLMATSDDPKARDTFAETILKQLDLMSAMAREVLQFARGESTLLVRKVYLTKFADEIRQQLEREFAGRDVELVIDLRHRGVADFDELRVYRLVHNLARNAASAMDGKGAFRITIDLDERGVQLTFADTGRGLSETMQKRLFQAFATEGKSDGTGLGLAIVKKIVDDHGGQIRYETRAGEGTTFYVTLPNHKAPPPPPTPRHP